MKRWLLVVLPLLVLAFQGPILRGGSVIGPDDRTEVPWGDPLRTSVVELKSQRYSWQCTGWVIGPQSVVTSAHCLWDGNWRGPFFVRSNDWLVAYVLNSDLWVPDEWKLTEDPRFDYGVLTTDRPMDILPIPWAVVNKQPEIGSLMTVGFPADLQGGPYWSTGKACDWPVGFASHQSDTFPGSSGGPILALRIAVGVHGYGTGFSHCDPTCNCGPAITDRVAADLLAQGADDPIVLTIHTYIFPVMFK